MCGILYIRAGIPTVKTTKSVFLFITNSFICEEVLYEPFKSGNRKLAAYIKDMNYDHFDAHTIDITKMCILDFMGVAIAGSAKKESSIWKEYYAEKVTAPQASLFQPGFQNMTAEQAAALNAVFGHVMDMDDVHNASITHLAVITVPTAFALAQKLHLSSKQVIEAVAAGYEAGARIGETITPPPTSTGIPLR